MASGRAKVWKYKMELVHQIWTGASDQNWCIYKELKIRTERWEAREEYGTREVSLKEFPVAKLEHVDQQNNDATHEFTDGNDYMNEWCRHDIISLRE